MLTTDGVARWVSPSAVESLGWCEPRAIVHPDDVPTMAAAIRRSATAPATVAHRARRVDGRWIRVRSTIERADLGAGRDGAIVMAVLAVDLADAHDGEQAAARYRQLVEHSGEAVVVHVGGVLVAASPPALQLLEVADVVGRPVSDFVAPESLAAAQERRRSIAAGGWPSPDRIVARTSSGAPLELEVSSFPAMWDGEPAIQLSLRRAGTTAVRPSEEDELIAEVGEAIRGGQIEVHYQPIVRASDGAVGKVEALVRWRHPTRGLLPPVAFVPAVERDGPIGELGGEVLRQACAQVASWRETAVPSLEIAVNLSVRELADTGLLARVADALRSSGLPPHALWLEVTETALADDPDAAEAALHRLRSLGVRLALDDFGTGFAHLAQLRRFPVQALKIDRSFVAGMGSHAGDAAIVRSVLALGRELGMVVVAEGVETAEQRDALAAMRCDLLQGYLFGRPVPAEELVLGSGGAGVDVDADGPCPDGPEGARLAAVAECRVLDTPPEDGFDALVRLAASACDAGVAFVAIADAERQWFKAGVGLDATEAPRAWAFGDDILAGVGPFTAEDHELGSVAGVPLVLRDGHAVGTLSVVGRRSRPFADHQLAALAVLGAQVVALLELRRVAARLDDDSAELARTRATLADRERFLAAVMGNTAELVVRLTPDGVLEYATASAERLLGYAPEDFIGRNALDLVHPDDIPSAVESLAGTAATVGSAVPIELRLLAADGSWVLVELVGTTVEEHDGQRRIVLTAREPLRLRR